MAKLNPHKLKQVTIDGVAAQVPESARIADVVAPEVSAVEVFNDNLGKLELIPRGRFHEGVPQGMNTQLTPIAKGGVLS